jgi:hypothetical protein
LRKIAESDHGAAATCQTNHAGWLEKDSGKEDAGEMHEFYLEGIAVKDLGGEALRKRIVVTKFPAVIGRNSECEHCLNLAFISRRHCAFFLRDDLVWVQDLQSQNGTFLNGESVQDPQPIHDGDRLDLSYLSFQVRFGVCRIGSHDRTTGSEGAGMEATVNGSGSAARVGDQRAVFGRPG